MVEVVACCHIPGLPVCNIENLQVVWGWDYVWKFLCLNLGHFKFQSPSSPLVRANSLTAFSTPFSPRTALAVACEFIEPAEEVDLTSDPGGRTALHLAIVHCHPKVVDILLQHKGGCTTHVMSMCTCMTCSGSTICDRIWEKWSVCAKL